ncbi:MAG: tRNA dihydrouridine(20/20a) synthase DusA [Gammaproteobacteria bacterium]|nr:tRNA dihydrouridine(20/20a) synthase DusA [Gammaproteobacteria bacterium]
MSSKLHLISIAPMLGYTDRHFRYFMRLITQHTFLYTEMIAAQALLHQNFLKFLNFNEIEHPIALQLAGNNPTILAQAAKRVEQHGYDEINFNVGCPSPRVQSGQFGCCLLENPLLVSDCFKAMQDAVTIPVTIKTRLGLIANVEDETTQSNMGESRLVSTKFQPITAFIEMLSEAGCKTFILHARFADLIHYTPRQNRTLPPLHDKKIYQLKNAFPHLEMVFNGGIKTEQDIDEKLKTNIDGVMIGQAAYHNPYFLIHADEKYYQDTHAKLDREQIVEKYLIYMEQETKKGSNKKYILRHLPNLFRGIPLAKQIRNMIVSTALL